MLISFLLFILPIIAVMSIVPYMGIYFIINKRLGKRSFWYHCFRYVFLVYCISLFYLTIGWYYPEITFKPEFYMLNLQPFIWVKQVYIMGASKMAEQLILNIAMFIPMGSLLPLIFEKMKKPLYGLLAVLATTVGIETLQYFIGRSADIDDVIMNFLGGVIGFVICRLICKHKKTLES